MKWPDIYTSHVDQTFIGITIFYIIFAGGGPLLGIPLFGRASGLMSYSKFVDKGASNVKVPSVLGMFLIYSPSCLGGCLALKSYASSERGNLAALMMAIHFGKRTFETLAIHKYSGTMPLISSLNISIVYTVATAIVCYYGESVGGDVEGLGKRFGFSLFFLGLVGNLYHHWLLASLRKSGEKRYKIPRGGLFEYVAAPHYLFELIGWLGVVILVDHFCVFLLFFGMMAYLVDRARAQTAFNVKKIDGYPKSRGHILPFLF